eukprot:PhF_6_TR3237/c0_g2_i1/m.4609
MESNASASATASSTATATSNSVASSNGQTMPITTQSAQQIVAAAGAAPGVDVAHHKSAKTMEQRYISKLYTHPPSLDKTIAQPHKSADQVKAHMAAQHDSLQTKHADQLVRLSSRHHQEQIHLTQRQKEKTERVLQDQKLHGDQQAQRLTTHQMHQREKLHQEHEQHKIDRVHKLETQQRAELERLRQKHLEQKTNLQARLQRDDLLFKHAQNDLVRKQEGERFALAARQEELRMRVLNTLDHRTQQQRADLLAKQREEIEHKKTKQESEMIHLEKRQQRHHPEAFMGSGIMGPGGNSTTTHTPGILGALRSVMPF